jgi:hypothetical protein
MFERTTPKELAISHTALRQFRESGFRTEREEYDPEGFGDVVIDLVSPELELRFTRDRGQSFIRLRKPGESEWFNEHTVLTVTGAKAVADALVEEKWASAERVSSAVFTHLDAIRRAFSDTAYPDARAAMNAIEREYAFRVFGYVPPN